jgi:hypothetical protein
MSVALLVCAGLLGAPSSARALQQDDTPSLTTQDVLDKPDAVTTRREAKPPEATATAVGSATAPKPAAKGYTRMKVSGYSFERPEGWKPIANLEASGTPTFFKYDAVFQDPTTGAVISAVSVDQASLQTPIDIENPQVVNSLLNSMLNPAQSKSGVKLFRQVTGKNEDGSKWLRIKAQGNGQAVDGSVVDTTFWVQFVQSADKLALVAVGYPTTQQNAVAQIAFHTVRTLEMENAPGPGAAPAGPRPRPGGPRTP